MRNAIATATILGLTLVSALPLNAQSIDRPLRPIHWQVGASFVVAEPQEEFRDNVGTSFGGSVNGLWTPEANGVVGLRMEAGVIGYGSETKRVMLSPTVGGRIMVDLNTSNIITFAHIGPQFTFRTPNASPYIAPSIGFTYIATVSSVSGHHGDSFAEDTNYDDGMFSYGATAGSLVPVSRGRVPVSIDVSVRYHHNGPASYLVKGSIQDNPDGTISFNPYHTNANLLTFQIGASVGLRPRSIR